MRQHHFMLFAIVTAMPVLEPVALAGEKDALIMRAAPPDRTNAEQGLLQLRKGTAYAEVIQRFGEPDAAVGSGFLIIEYRFADGRRIQLNFMGSNTLQIIHIKDRNGVSRTIEPAP